MDRKWTIAFWKIILAGIPAECLLHPIWVGDPETVCNYLEHTTVADLARMRRSTP